MNREMYEQLRQITEEEAEILKGRREIDRERYVSIPNQNPMDLDSKRLLDSGKLIRIRPHTRFIHFPRHTHNFVEVIYMCSGRTTHIVNGDKVILKQGELLFLSRKAMIRKFIVGCLRGAESDIGYLHFKVADVLPIQNLVENLIWTIMNNQQKKRSINQFTMGLLFLQLINYTDKVEVGKDHFDQELILSVYRFIEEHYKDGELSDIGRAVGYDNLSCFHRIFREKYGVSPRQWRRGLESGAPSGAAF